MMTAAEADYIIPEEEVAYQDPAKAGASEKVFREENNSEETAFRKSMVRIIPVILVLLCISLFLPEVAHAAPKTGAKVKSIKITGYRYFTPGKSSKMHAEIKPAKAKKKKLKWTSSNPSVARVNQKGKVTGILPGTATITARATDGSGKKAKIRVVIFKFSRSEIKWAGHRGMPDAPYAEDITENTAMAFRLAGEYGLWGCECDVWETKHDTDGSFDIVINHDPSFKRIQGVNRLVRDMTATEIRTCEGLDNVCFLDEYLSICAEYGMVPLVELKGENMTEDGVKRIIDMLAMTVKWNSPDDAYIMSTSPSLLEAARNYCRETYGFEMMTMYVVNLRYAYLLEDMNCFLDFGCSGICLNKDLMTSGIDSFCRENGLQVFLWTYWDKVADINQAYQYMQKDKYKIDAMIIQQILFN